MNAENTYDMAMGQSSETEFNIKELCTIMSKCLINERYEKKTGMNLQNIARAKEVNYGYGMTSSNARKNEKIINVIIDIVVDSMVMSESYLHKWINKGAMLKTALYRNPRLVKVLQCAIFIIVVQDKRSKLSRNAVRKKINNIVFKIGAKRWVWANEIGQHKEVYALIKSYAATYELLIDNMRESYVRNMDDLISILRKRGNDIIHDAIWMTNNYGQSFEKISIHPYVRGIMANYCSKLSHIWLKTAQLLERLRDDKFKCYLTPIGTLFYRQNYNLEFKGTNNLIDKICKDLRDMSTIYRTNATIDITQFDDEASMLAAYFIDTNFDLVVYSTSNQMLEGVSQELYGSSVYGLHALQIIVNHLLCKYMNGVTEQDIIEVTMAMETRYSNEHNIDQHKDVIQAKELLDDRKKKVADSVYRWYVKNS